MILVVVGQLVVEEQAGLQVFGDPEEDLASKSCWRPGSCHLAPSRLLPVGRCDIVELIRVFARGDFLVLADGQGHAICVVDGQFADRLREVEENSSDGCKDETDDEERGQYRSRCEDWLPSLESLLLEGRVW